MPDTPVTGVIYGMEAAPLAKHAEQLAADLVPHGAGETATPASESAAGVASTRAGGLVIGQDAPQRIEGLGVMTGPLQLCKRVQYRADEPSSVGVIVQPGKGPGR